MLGSDEHKKAIELLKATLREMKEGLNRIDDLKLERPKKLLAKHMHEIYAGISVVVEEYEKSKGQDDLNRAFRQIEIFKPAFMLSYSEILG